MGRYIQLSFTKGCQNRICEFRLKLNVESYLIIWWETQNATNFESAVNVDKNWAWGAIHSTHLQPLSKGSWNKTITCKVDWLKTLWGVWATIFGSIYTPNTPRDLHHWPLTQFDKALTTQRRSRSLINITTLKKLVEGEQPIFQYLTTSCCNTAYSYVTELQNVIWDYRRRSELSYYMRLSLVIPFNITDKNYDAQKAGEEGRTVNVAGF